MEDGSKLDAYASFEDELNYFCKKHNVCFTKGSSLKTKDPNLEHLKYEYIVLCCKQGVKRNLKSKFSTGQRKSLKLLSNSDARQRLSLWPVAKRNPPQLEITISMHEHTGHEVSKEMCRLYLENRKLELNAATHLLMSCTMIQASEARQVLEQQHEWDLLPRDIYNIKSRINKSSSDATETQSILDSISEAGGSVSYGLTENGEFKYLSYD